MAVTRKDLAQYGSSAVAFGLLVVSVAMIAAPHALRERLNWLFLVMLGLQIFGNARSRARLRKPLSEIAHDIRPAKEDERQPTSALQTVALAAAIAAMAVNTFT